MAEQYQEEYDNFILNYKKGQVDGEDIGALVARMAHYFAQKNIFLIDKESALDRKSAEIVSKTDEATNKQISVAKAEFIIKSLPEYSEVRALKTHLGNIDQYINALKYLQKGVLNEYSHMQNQ